MEALQSDVESNKTSLDEQKGTLKTVTFLAESNRKDIENLTAKVDSHLMEITGALGRIEATLEVLPDMKEKLGQLTTKVAIVEYVQDTSTPTEPEPRAPSNEVQIAKMRWAFWGDPRVITGIILVALILSFAVLTATGGSVADVMEALQKLWN